MLNIVKKAGRQVPKIRLFFRKSSMWDQYLPEICIGNLEYGIDISNNHEMLILENLEYGFNIFGNMKWECDAINLHEMDF